MLVKTQSPFQTVHVETSTDHGQQLFLNDTLAISENDIAYCTALVEPFLQAEDTSEIVILGGGHGGVLNQLIKTLKPENRIGKATLVEIDIEVVRTAKAKLSALHQDIFEHPTANIVIGDALYVIEHMRCINGFIVDLNLNHLRENDSTVERFFKAIRKSLKPGSTISFKIDDLKTNDIDSIISIAGHYFEKLNEQTVWVPSLSRHVRVYSAKKPIPTDCD